VCLTDGVSSWAGEGDEDQDRLGFSNSVLPSSSVTVTVAGDRQVTAIGSGGEVAGWNGVET
jgi:hypothetical protein